MESAAIATQTPDFGRRLALRQGIDILGPVGVAARTAATMSDAFAIVVNYLSAYGPAIEVGLEQLDDPKLSFSEFRILLDRLPPHPQTIELALGVSLQVLRFLLGADYHPVFTHLPHEPLAPRRDYRRFYGSPVRFSEPRAGFTIRTADLDRPLSQDRITHQAVVHYLDSVVTTRDQGTRGQVADLVRRLLPTGAATLEVVATQFALHPKALQRRLATEGTNFNAVVEQVRKDAAERYLRDTEMDLTHLSRELGYAEQSVLTRSCQRWFGRGPVAHLIALRQGQEIVAHS